MLRPQNLFKPAVRYPADPRAVFILALSVFAGFGLVLNEQGPETLEALMPGWAVTVWGLSLFVGSVVALAGLWRDSDNGIIAEQIGSVMVGAATVFYSVIALWVIGTPASQPVFIVLAWGLSCFARWVQLQLLIHQRVRERMAEAITEALTQDPEDG